MMLQSLRLSSRSEKAISIPSKKKKKTAATLTSSGSSASSSSSAVYNSITKLADQDILSAAEICASDEMRTNSDSEASSAGVAERASADTRSERDQIYPLSSNISSASDEVNGAGGGGGGGGGADVNTLLSLRDLLTDCSISVCQGRWHRSVEVLRALRQKAAADGGDGGAQRMASHFADILSATVHEKCSHDSEYRSWLQRQDSSLEERSSTARGSSTRRSILQSLDEESIQNASLSFNQATPYLRFLHLTANQAILEAVERKRRVHVVDVEIMQGLQWPPFMQAMAEREGGPPAVLKITGGGRERRVLEQVGQRLRKFAESVGIGSFEYEAVEYGTKNNKHATAVAGTQQQHRAAAGGLRLRPSFRPAGGGEAGGDGGGGGGGGGGEEEEGKEREAAAAAAAAEEGEEGGEEEALVVNCVLQVGDLPWNYSARDRRRGGRFAPVQADSNMRGMAAASAGTMLAELLAKEEEEEEEEEEKKKKKKKHRPLLVAVAEPEVDFSSASSFEARFLQAERHYAAMFESLDATLPPSCQHRAVVENVWLRSQLAGLLLLEDHDGDGDDDGGGDGGGGGDDGDGDEGSALGRTSTSECVADNNNTGNENDMIDDDEEEEDDDGCDDDDDHRRDRDRRAKRRNGVLYHGFTSAPSWRARLLMQGFHPVPPSDFAISQARLLLRLRYPSEGYHLFIPSSSFNPTTDNSGSSNHRQREIPNPSVSASDQHSLALGWQGTPLFTVSAWKSPPPPPSSSSSSSPRAS